MITQFDKIYVISLITNKDRQEFVTYQMNELGLDFEFIYGTDFNNITYDYFGNKINYPLTYNCPYRIPGSFGCTITHYNAVLYAYYLGYNNVLILEDDICFIKDKQLIEYYLNNIPQDADFVTWNPRFEFKKEFNIVADKIRNANESWILLENSIIGLLGGLMYGIMNRDSMKLYIDNQHNRLKLSDHIDGFFEAPIIKRYTSSKHICTDQQNIFTNFNAELYDEFIYEKIDNTITTDSFYIPNNFLPYTTR